MPSSSRSHLTAVLAGLLIFSSTAFAAGDSYSSSYGGSSSNASGQTETQTTPLQRAATFNRAGNYGEAISQLTQITAYNPENADAWNELGFAYRNIKDYDLSAAAYDKALTLDPNHLGALNYQGFMFLETDRPDLAKENAAKLQNLCSSCDEFLTLDAAIKDM